MINFDIKLLIDFIEEGKTAEEIAKAYKLDVKYIKELIDWVLNIKENSKKTVENLLYNKNKIEDYMVYNLIVSKPYRNLHNIKLIKNTNNEPVIEHPDNLKAQKYIIQVDDKYFVIRCWGKKANACFRQIALEVVNNNGHWELKYD